MEVPQQPMKAVVGATVMTALVGLISLGKIAHFMKTSVTVTKSTLLVTEHY